MQLHTFPDGGFVIHGITGLFSGRVSAWFSASRELLDCEQFIGSNRHERSIKRDGPLWSYIASIGASYPVPQPL